MVEKTGFVHLVLRAIVDKEFRVAVAKDPEGVIKEEGYAVTSEEMAGLKELKVEDWDAITVKELDERFQAIKPVVRAIEIEK